mgnify:CR=1 FL=1
MAFTIKRGDTAPKIKFTLRTKRGRVDIRGYRDIHFFMRDVENEEVIVADNIDGNIDVTNAEFGEVEYQWRDEDTDEIGNFEAEIEVEFGDGEVETFPNDGFVDIKIVEDIK